MTQKQKAGSFEKKFRLSWLDGLITPIFLLDQQGKITYCNGAIEKLTGYPKKHSCGKGLDVYIQPSDAARFIRDELKLFRGTPLDHVSYDFVRKDGGRTHAVLNLDPIFDSSRKRVEFIIAFVLEREDLV